MRPWLLPAPRRPDSCWSAVCRRVGCRSVSSLMATGSSQWGQAADVDARGGLGAVGVPLICRAAGAALGHWLTVMSRRRVPAGRPTAGAGQGGGGHAGMPGGRRGGVLLASDRGEGVLAERTRNGRRVGLVEAGVVDIVTDIVTRRGHRWLRDPRW